MKEQKNELPYLEPEWGHKNSSPESGPYRNYEYPKVSIIIPTQNSAHLIASTLKTLLVQDYPHFEVIVIDASSKDRTLEVIKSFRDPRVTTHSVSDYSRYEMLNKGITHATGDYLNFLFPGDFYLYKLTLREMMKLAMEKSLPTLVYCGTLLRDGRSEVKNLYRPLTIDLLKLGRQPTSLQSCWFKECTFKQVGKFDTNLKLRGGLDLLCRIELNSTDQAASIFRIYTDYDLRAVTRKMVFRHFYETFAIIFRYFGYGSALKWLFKQKDAARYLKLWWHSFQLAFVGK